MFKDFSTIDKVTTKNKTKTEDKNKTTLKTKGKTKTKDKDTLHKIDNQKSAINKLNKGLAKVKAEVTKKVELIYEAMCELQGDVYSDDSWLRLVELNKIDAITDDALNVVWNMICGKNSTKQIKIDEYKDIDGYVSKLTDVINNEIELVNRMCESIDHVMSEIKNETNMIDERYIK